MNHKKPTDLEKILERERTAIQEAAMRGKFGELSRLYTPTEQCVLAVAESIDTKIPYVSVALQYVRNIFVEVGKSIASFRKNKWIVVDDESDEQKMDALNQEEPTETNVERVEKPTKGVAHVLYFPGIQKVQLPASRDYLFRHAEQWANRRVATGKSFIQSIDNTFHRLLSCIIRTPYVAKRRDVIQRTYDFFVSAESALTENLQNLEQNRSNCNKRRIVTLDEENSISSEYTTLVNRAKELKCMMETLDDDYATNEQLMDINRKLRYIPAPNEGVIRLEKEFKRYVSISAVIKVEKDNAQNEYETITEHMARLELQIKGTQGVRAIIEMSIQSLNELYAAAFENKIKVITCQTSIEEHNMQYNAWKEMLEYAQRIPTPDDGRSIIQFLNDRISQLRLLYFTQFDITLQQSQSPIVQQNP